MAPLSLKKVQNTVLGSLSEIVENEVYRKIHIDIRIPEPDISQHSRQDVHHNWSRPSMYGDISMQSRCTRGHVLRIRTRTRRTSWCGGGGKRNHFCMHSKTTGIHVNIDFCLIGFYLIVLHLFLTDEVNWSSFDENCMHLYSYTSNLFRVMSVYKK